jgi:hypothetical protein
MDSIQESVDVRSQTYSQEEKYALEQLKIHPKV